MPSRCPYPDSDYQDAEANHGDENRMVHDRSPSVGAKIAMTWDGSGVHR